MNFPQVHGARIRPLPDPELAEAEARLAALDDDELVAARPEWIEETVAKVAGRAPEVRGGRLRRAAAAAVAFFALHGFATAATVTAVSAVAVTAVVLWPEGRNSSETMSYQDALDLLLRPDRGDEARSSALAQVVRRVRGTASALRLVAATPSVDESIRRAAVDGLRGLSDCLLRRRPATGSTPVDDPLAVVGPLLRSRDCSEVTVDAVQQTIHASLVGIDRIFSMPDLSDRLRREQGGYMNRLIKLCLD
jgi:hypothetical protein